MIHVEVSVKDVLLTLFTVGALLALLAVAWRYFVVRTKGIAVSMRRAQDSTDGHHWRHGVMVFSFLTV